MSDSESPAKVKPLGGVKEGNFAGMVQQDVDFLVACLRCTVGGSIVINTPKAAELLEYKNHRSITNRIKQMKDRYGLNMSGTTKSIVDDMPAGDEVETESFEESATKKTPKSAAKKAPATKASTSKTSAAVKKEKAAPKTKTPAKAPAAKKRKVSAISEEVSFPGLESAGDADVSGDGVDEKHDNAEEGEEEESA